MTRKTKILLAASTLLAAVIAATWLLLRPPPEPSYNGKSLSAWIDQYNANIKEATLPQNTNALAAFKEATAAIQHIGTNAVPTLLARMATRDSSFKRFIRTRFPERWADRFGFGAAYRHYVFRYRDAPIEAEQVFEYLNCPQAAYVPGLIEILRTNDNACSRSAAAQAIWLEGSATRTNLPDLIQCLNDPDPGVQSSIYAAIKNMVHWRTESERLEVVRVAVPLLNDLLKNPHTSPAARRWASSLLEQIESGNFRHGY